MVRNIYSVFTFFLMLFFSINVGLAQSNAERKGDIDFEKFAFLKAIEHYEQIKTPSEQVHRKLGDAYRYIGNTEKAEEHYAICANNSLAKANDVYFYASMLMSNGKYSEAEQWMDKFYSVMSDDSRGKAYYESHGFYEKLGEDRNQYKIKNIQINSAQEDFGTAWYKDKVVFASSREGGQLIARKWNWNELPFLDMYVAEYTDSLELTELKQFDKGLNNKFHEGPAVFADDGRIMAFTRNNYKSESSKGETLLEIYFDTYKDGKWQKETPFPHNSPEYSVGHPTLSPEGDVMYFASNMPGGYGGVDIYKSMNSDSGWSRPINLGPEINTEGNEMFPNYHRNGILFFASNGHVGLGGLDVFMARIREDGFGKVVNLGYPINDIKDDFALVYDEDMKKGFFSSNRPGGKGDDDIYAFWLVRPYVFGKRIKGRVLDKEGRPLANATVEWKDENGSVLQTITTDDSANYLFETEEEKGFILNGEKDGYFGDVKSVSTDTKEDEVVQDLILDKDPGLALYGLVTEKRSNIPLEGVQVEIVNNFTGKQETWSTDVRGGFTKALTDKKLNERISYNIFLIKEGYASKSFTYNKLLDKEGVYNMHEEMDFALDPMEVGMDLSKIIDINPIYFDVNKSNIRPDAAVELDKIVKVMMENPTIVIELGSHTDCRASAAYNMALSDRRAKSSAKYIQERIDDPQRIYGKGYGESKLVNECECEGKKVVPCTEEQHQENRRTEFTIIKM